MKLATYLFPALSVLMLTVLAGCGGPTYLEMNAQRAIEDSQRREAIRTLLRPPDMRCYHYESENGRDRTECYMYKRAD